MTVVLALGVAIGTMIMATPTSGHFQSSIDHIWSHIKPKADRRYLQNTIVITETSGSITPGNLGSARADCPSEYQAVGGGLDLDNEDRPLQIECSGNRAMAKSQQAAPPRDLLIQSGSLLYWGSGSVETLRERLDLVAGMIGPSKPLLIGETGSTESGGSGRLDRRHVRAASAALSEAHFRARTSVETPKFRTSGVRSNRSILFLYQPMTAPGSHEYTSNTGRIEDDSTITNPAFSVMLRNSPGQ
jgi:hypothetical protein